MPHATRGMMRIDDYKYTYNRNCTFAYGVLSRCLTLYEKPQRNNCLPSSINTTFQMQTKHQDRASLSCQTHS